MYDTGYLNEYCGRVTRDMRRCFRVDRVTDRLWRIRAVCAKREPIFTAQKHIGV